MKKLIMVGLVVLLAACDPSVRDTSHRYIIPDNLKDCSFQQLDPGAGSPITVVRCPNSSVSTITAEKNPVAVVTIDGVEYQKVVK